MSPLTDITQVSIPFWVFSLPRREPGTISRGIDKFQSRSGFSPCLDACVCKSVTMLRRVFQSRSGFSPCLDPVTVDGRSKVACVSIPFWVFSLPRHGARDLALRRPVVVSIPFWVFSLPRLRTCVPDSILLSVSIPFWVFSLPRHAHGVEISASHFKFQSRSGFSPCLDGRHEPRP